VGLRVGSDRTATRAPRRAGALSFEHGAALASEGGGSENGVDDHPWMDLEGHVVDGLAFDAGGLGDLLELLAAHAFESYVFQGDRKADLQAEVHDLLEYLGRALLEHEHVHLGLLPAPW
jgi:hypothetical protein